MALSQKVSESAGVAFNSSLKDTETTNYPVQISVTSFQFLIKGYEDMRNYAIQLQKAYFQFLIKGYHICKHRPHPPNGTFNSSLKDTYTCYHYS